MKKTTSKITAIILAAVMIIGILPAGVFADTEAADPAPEYIISEVSEPLQQEVIQEEGPAEEETEAVIPEEETLATGTGDETVLPAEEDTEAENIEDTAEIIDENAQTEETGEITGEAEEEILTEEDLQAEEASEEKTEEAPAETAYPEAYFCENAGELTVIIDAPEGALPEGTTVRVTEIPASQVIDGVQAAVSGNVTELYAADITFIAPDGTEIEPLTAVNVTMIYPGMAPSDYLWLVHIADNGRADTVEASVSGDSASFSSDSFSIYVAAASNETEDIIMTVHITNILNNSKKSDNGRAVPFESQFVMKLGSGVSSQGKLATGFYSLVGGKNIKANGIGATYTFLNAFVLNDSENGVVTAESAGSDAIRKITLKNDRNTYVELMSGETIVFENISDIYISPVYSVKLNWYLNYRYIDNVSTGSGSWSNLDGVSSFRHTFRDPSVATPVSHYSFAYWKDSETGNIYGAGDSFTYTGQGQAAGTTKDVNIYAWWQPSLSVELYDQLGSRMDESFESFEAGYTKALYSFSCDDNTDGTVFEGWYDENGQRYSDDTVISVPELTTEKGKNVVIRAYARFVTERTVEKIWTDDDNAFGTRPDTLGITLKANGTAAATALLSDENNWQYTFSGLDAYQNGSLIEYTAEETAAPEGYRPSVSEEDGIITITNTAVPAITVKAADGTWTYDGNAHSDMTAELTEGKLFLGDVLEASSEGSVTNVTDTIEGNNVVTSVRILRGEEDVTDMYQITLLPGTLTVEKAEVTVTVTGRTARYTQDGSIHRAEGFTLEADNDLYDTESMIFTGSAEVSRSTVGKSYMGLTEEMFSNEDENFEVTLKINDGYVEIAPVPVVPVQYTEETPSIPGGGDSEEVIPETEVPQAQPAQLPIVIPEMPAPLAGPAWALVNLILALLTVLGSIILLIGGLREKKEEEKEEEETADEKVTFRRRRRVLRALSLIPAAAAVIAFILTEDMSLRMVLTDGYTLLMAIIALIQAGMMIISRDKKDNEEKEAAAMA